MEPATNTDNVSVVEHTSFAVSDTIGDMVPGGYHGYFADDTRFLSYLTLRISGRRPERLSTRQESHRAAAFFLTNPRVGPIPRGSVSIFRERKVSHHLRERITLTSHVLERVELRVEIRTGSDFADIFEVRRRERSRRAVRTELLDARTVRYAYQRERYRRTTSVRFSRPFEPADPEFHFRAVLDPGVPWELEILARPSDHHARDGRPLPMARRRDPAGVRRWASALPRLETDDARLAAAWHQAMRDLEALLLQVPEGGYIAAAGLPWYLAVFGRDAAITARQALLLGPDLPLGTLRQLAAYQGSVDDRFREEQPGKIPHEVRLGELAAFNEIPHGRYYGSLDATPLFVTLFVEACRWSGWLAPDRALGEAPAASTHAPARPLPPSLASLLPAVERALEWIDRHATGPQGLVWYRPQHGRALRNQAWKDSADSYRFADGGIAQPPIAPVEVQGYVREAKLGMADVFTTLGRRDDARRLAAEAAALAAALDEAFWLPDEGFYAMGLDRRGRRIDSLTSNPGHLLWSGAIPAERAAPIVERLMGAEFFSGWGIRTMSSRMRAFNPLSYHNGSVWPHDTSLIAAGMARYGFGAQAWRVLDALLDAAVADPVSRLPELYAGYDREVTRALVQYPVACAPQAWATGAVILALQTMLGIPPWSLGGGARLDRAPEVRLTATPASGWSAPAASIHAIAAAR